MDDIGVVLDAVGSKRAALFGGAEGGPMCALFAATFPERTSALVLGASYARRGWAPDYPWGLDEQTQQRILDGYEERWGRIGFGSRSIAPTLADDERFQVWYAQAQRFSGTPASAREWFRITMDIDVRDVLPAIRVPTLVIHRSGDRVIPGRVGPLPRRAHPRREVRRGSGRRSLPVRRRHRRHRGRGRGVPDGLTTRTRARPRARDGALHRHRRLDRARRRPRRPAVDRAPRGPPSARARRSSSASRQGSSGSRATGPVDVRRPARARALREADPGRGSCARDRDPRRAPHGRDRARGYRHEGIAVHIGARVAALAQAGEVLTSSTVKDLVVGSGIDFEDRGTHTLKGVPGEWHVHAVADGRV